MRTTDLNNNVGLDHHSLDLSNAKRNWNKTPGYTEVETTAFKHILTPPDNSDPSKFVDVWRNLHPNDRHFTYFSYRFNCRMKGIGWRLDMCMQFLLYLWFITDGCTVVVSERMIDRVAMVSLSYHLLRLDFTQHSWTSVKYVARSMGLQIIVQ